jgi:heme/copper-type cytochrome/quinol oxidase subunit 3
VIGFGGWLYSLRDKEPRKTNLILVVFLAVVVALFVKFNQQYFQAQGRYLLPAIGPISAIIAVGYAKLAGKRTAAPLLGIAALLLVVNAFALIRMETQFNDRIQAAGTGSPAVMPKEPAN